jgi:hypothetical protein
MVDVTCKNCVFFRNAQVMGSCRRYPSQQNKHENDWCGEHQPGIMVAALPVYDIMTDTTTMPPERKKPGRKPKDGNHPVA